MFLDMSTLIDLNQMTFLICHAYPSGNMTILCQSIFQTISNHHIMVNIFFFLLRSQEIICHLKCMYSIIVICIDNSKWSVNLINTA